MGTIDEGGVLQRGTGAVQIGAETDGNGSTTRLHRTHKVEAIVVLKEIAVAPLMNALLWSVFCAVANAHAR